MFPYPLEFLLPISNDKRIHVIKFKMCLVTMYFKTALETFTINCRSAVRKK